MSAVISMSRPPPENLPRSKSAPRTGFSLARRESCETVNTRKGQVTGRTFKPKLQDDLLTRPFSS
jgi:hypothetical protein